ncbi:alpha/beta hydrolase [Psychroserpens sp. XS_ASV72]|uniref:alpha/beta hydrolase n=1 Tax=Psychroserpens sp. XS_ASV72 TaxID=3241293 RepID=UPI003512B56B
MNKWIYVLLICTFFSCKEEAKKSVEEPKQDLKSLAGFKEVKDIQLYGGSLYRLESYPSKFIKSRPVDVWLPKNYSEDYNYAVVYMHDGQMLFDASQTWNKQEWEVDEWATKLVGEDLVKDFIVVGIHNISDIRWFDLFPENAINYLSKEEQESLADYNGKSDYELQGNNYLNFLVKELKPLIDKTFSVSTDKSNTFVMGSSMGGLMSMYAVSEYPDVFGGAACISTHWVGAKPGDINPLPEAIFKYMEDHLPKAGQHKLYFDYGNQTLDQYYPQYAPRVDAILEAKGYTKADAVNLFFEGKDHSENSWNQRLNKPLVFLLDK